tara:strand:+ start:73 stop:1221 length:1149 start_codon:yes stop_codon:yes gene_type:complete
MIYFIYFIIINTLILLIIDLIIAYFPKSKLELIPQQYKTNSNEVKFEFKIINTSINKETMVPDLDIELNNLDNGNLINLDHEKEIIIDDGIKIQNFKNNWKTTIVKSNSFIKVCLVAKTRDILLENNSIWLKINWSNYGHFGFIKKQDCFLLKNSNGNRNTNQLIKKIGENNYMTIAVKTEILGIFDDPIKTISEYCKDVVKRGDILIIGETPLAIMQGRYINPLNIRYSLFAKLLCYFFHPTSSLATACGMQILINKIGITRIIYSLIIGICFKLIGIKGLFYRLTGKESSLIDDISGTTFPYDKSIVMGPINTRRFCQDVSKMLGVQVAVADVNDLGKVKIIATSNKSNIKILEKNLKTNPAGNADQKTPIVIIRKNIIK